MVVDAPPDEAKLSRLVAKWAVEARQPQLARRMKAFEELYELAREFGPRVSPALDVLLEGLEDADLQIGESAVWALGYCLPDSLEPLAACLAHPAALVRERAAHALGNVGEDARPAATPLRGLLIDTVQAVRSRAAWALGLLHDADPATASGLIAMLAHGTPGDQQSALHAIGNLGKASDSELDWSPHTELITAGLWSTASGTRRCALYALEALDLDPAREAELLVRLLQCEQDSEVLQAALGRLESLAALVDLSPHVRMITGLVPHGTRVARTVCEVLGVVRHGTPETIAVLIEGERAADCLLKALARMFESQPESACDVVCLLGPVAAPLIPRVVAALAEEHWDLQWAAADALGAIASGTPETLAALLQAMAHRWPTGRGPRRTPGRRRRATRVQGRNRARGGRPERTESACGSLARRCRMV